MTLTIHPATPERWNDIRVVFGTHGDPSRCFCQYFIDSQWNQGRKTNQDALRRQVDTLDPPPGLLAYRDREPVGWIQTGPSPRYTRFKPKGHAPADSIWVITCFVVRTDHRGTGVATALLNEAIHHARQHGVTTLRARPTDTSITKKTSSGLFTGILSTFDTAGFSHINHNRSRVLVELNLRREPTADSPGDEAFVDGTPC